MKFQVALLVAAMSLMETSRDAIAQNPSRAKGQARSVAPGSAENPARQRPVPVPLSIVPRVTTPPPPMWRKETNDEVYAELHIGTNVYRNAKILKTTSTNAMIKVDGGIIRASASDLTPEIRQKYFSIERIVALENSGDKPTTRATPAPEPAPRKVNTDAQVVTEEYARIINAFAVKYDMTAEEVIRVDYVLGRESLTLGDLDQAMAKLGESRDKALGYHLEDKKRKFYSRRLVAGETKFPQNPTLSKDEKNILNLLKAVGY